MREPYRFLHDASLLIAHHHERWDGAGYPFGIRSTYIPLGSRIHAIADAFDAIISEPSPATRKEQGSAIQVLQIGAGSQFDPALLSMFTRSIGGMSAGDPYLNRVPIHIPAGSDG